MAHPHAAARADETAKARHLITRTGYKRGGAVGDEAEDARMVSRGVHEHEANMHKGEPKTKLKLRSGGSVDGESARHHLAKRARGGATHGKKGSTKVNVIVAPQGGGGARPVPVPVPTRPPMAVGAPPPAPVGAPPMGAGMPMGARPGMPPPGAPMMRARGGKVPHMEAGAASGPGRIEKTHEYGEGGFKPKKRMIHKG